MASGPNWLSTLLGESAVDNDFFTVHRPLVAFTGDLAAGAMLGRLLFWTGKGEHPDGWIYKSDADWQRELCLARHSVRSARKRLEQLELIEVKEQMSRAKGSNTNHYRVRMNVLRRRWNAWLERRAPAPPLSEHRQWSEEALSEDEQCSDGALAETEHCSPATGAELSTSAGEGVDNPPHDESSSPQPLSESEQWLEEALSENGQGTVRKQTGHCLNSDRALSENAQSITGETTGDYSADTTAETETEEGRNDAAPAAPEEKVRRGRRRRAPTKEPDPNMLHPANIAFREHRERWPNKAQMAEIAVMVPDTPEALKRWKAVLKAYMLAGDNNPLNIVAQLDWFRDGIPDHARSRAPQRPTAEQTDEGDQSHLPESEWRPTTQEQEVIRLMRHQGLSSDDARAVWKRARREQVDPASMWETFVYHYLQTDYDHEQTLARLMGDPLRLSADQQQWLEEAWRAAENDSGQPMEDQ